jgi:hypothetical protein
MESVGINGWELSLVNNSIGSIIEKITYYGLLTN